MIKSHQVFVVWGERVDEETKPSHYSFNTQMELDAFILGINEASGWFDAATFDTKEEALSYIKEECRD